MSLDMIGPAVNNPNPHYRRYLGISGRITVVCVQSFDYVDYDASRFVDLAAFDSQIEAEIAPLDLTQAIQRADDREAAAEALRLILAVAAGGR